MSAAIVFALGSGLLSAVLYASALVGAAGGLALVFVVPLPLFLVGLSREAGWRGAALAALAGTLAVALGGGLAAGANFGVAEAVPPLLVAYLAGLRRDHADGSVEWYPPGRLLVWLALYGACVLLAFVLYYASAEGGLEGTLQRSAAALFQELGLPLTPPTTALVNAFVSILPGLGGASWLLIVAGNAALAETLLQRFGHALRPVPAFVSLALPAPLALGAVAAAVLGLSGSGLGFAARNLAFVLVVPYFFTGLACLHLLVTRWQLGARLIVPFYIMLIGAIVILSWLAVMAIAVLGLVDQAAGLRRRLARP